MNNKGIVVTGQVITLEGSFFTININNSSSIFKVILPYMATGNYNNLYFLACDAHKLNKEIIVEAEEAIIDIDKIFIYLKKIKDIRIIE